MPRQSKPVTEYRMVCANYGTSGHSSHAWKKKSRKILDDAIEVANQHSSKVATPFSLSEIPYKAQERTITKWKDVA